MSSTIERTRREMRLTRTPKMRIFYQVEVKPGEPKYYIGGFISSCRQAILDTVGDRFSTPRRYYYWTVNFTLKLTHVVY